MSKFNFIFEDTESQRLDMFVALKCDISRNMAVKLIDGGNVTVDGKPENKKMLLKSGSEIEVVIPEPEEYSVEAENIPINIVFEDDSIIVVNKAKNMVVHPANGNYSGTLVNAVLYHCGSTLSGINGVMRPGILHRIDKNTSGLLVIAKNDEAHTFLAQQIKEHSFTREYEAIIYGTLRGDSGKIDAPIGRHPAKRKQMAVTERNNKEAITHYEVIERFNDFTHVRLRLETGRTHQIRVHMSYIGHPVAGDEVYGPKKVITELSGQCLHAKKLGFIHPSTREYIEFEAPLPEYFGKFIEGCRS